MHAFTKTSFEKGDWVIKFVEHVFAQHYVGGLLFEIYEHRDKQGTLRECRSCTSDVNTAFEAMRMELNPQQEIGLVSRVHLDPRVLDASVSMIPMIDFQTAVMTEELKTRIGLALGFCSSQEMLIFETDRSFHGYVNGLGTEGDWRRFMGQMLLLNKGGQPSTVDARWLGHKLKLGYGMLRLSANTARHQHMPHYLCTIAPEISKDPNADEDYA